MAAPKTPADKSIYQLKVTLKGIRPPIWRRIQVPGDINLGKLHRILQVVMGWSDSHLHLFTSGGMEFGVPDREFGMETRNERTARLSQVVRGEKSKIVYEYDFGDSWEHVVLVEKILPPDPSVRYPTCLKGKRACPPEDCGGVWGYADLLEALADPKHEQHQEMRRWIGGDFDPEAFDLDAVNRQLQQLR